MFEQRKHVADDGVDVDRVLFVVIGARPRQIEKPVHDLRGAERLLLDLLQQNRPWIARVGAFEQHLREARNPGERRVDLVRHAGSEQADGRHLLGDLQLLFELHVVGDVFDEQNRSDDRVRPSRGFLQRHDRRVHQQLLRLAAGRHGRSRPARQRHAIERRAKRVVALRGVQGFDKRPVEDIRELSTNRAGARHAVEAFERAIPAHDPLVDVEHHQAIVEGFEDVLVELAHPSKFFRLEMKLAIEASVFNRGRHLAGDRRQQREVFAVERLVRVLASKRQHGDGAALEHAGHEVVDAGIAPELDVFSDKERGGDRIVERDGMAGVEARDERRLARERRHDAS